MNRELRLILFYLITILINIACWYFSDRSVKLLGIQINLLTAIIIAVLMIEPIVRYIINYKRTN